MIEDGASLQHLDLNVLVAFDVLVEERNVTKAARRMGVTQSAMSHTLRRLRELLDDPLLVRGRGGMVLTPRAESLAVPLRSALRSVARAMTQPAVFVPAEARRTFRIIAPDLFEILAFPPLLRRLQSEAPGIDLAVVPIPARLSDDLETGKIDLAIAPLLLESAPVDLGAETTPDLRRRTLFVDSHLCFVRAGHPAINTRRRLSLRAFTELSHVLVSPIGQGPGLVDRALEPTEARRRVAVRVTTFASALSIVAQSDLVLTGPRSLERCAMASGLVTLAAPVALPQHAITMVWHPRFHADPAHRWFRECLVEVTAALSRSRDTTPP